jgi:hypothetical protein
MVIPIEEDNTEAEVAEGEAAHVEDTVVLTPDDD